MSPVITKEELKGEPAREQTVTKVADLTPADTRTQAQKDADAQADAAREAERARARDLTIGATEARDVGPTAVTRGALTRAEAAVRGANPMPVTPAGKPDLARVWVTPDGAAHDTPPAGASVQLVGAEAEAYKAAHGGKAEAGDAEKAKPKAANKSRAKSANKSANKAKRR